MFDLFSYFHHFHEVSTLRLIIYDTLFLHEVDCLLFFEIRVATHSVFCVAFPNTLPSLQANVEWQSFPLAA